MFYGIGNGNGNGYACGKGKKNVERWILPLPQSTHSADRFSCLWHAHMCYRRCLSRRRRPSTLPLPSTL